MNTLLCAVLCMPALRVKADPHPEQVYEPLVSRLSEEGFPREFLADLLLDGEKAFYPDVIRLHLARKESESPYISMHSPRAIAAVRKFLQEHHAFFQSAYRDYQVDPAAVSAILYVESRFGKNTGQRPVLYVLSSVSMADEQWMTDWLIGEIDQWHPETPESERQETTKWIKERAKHRAGWAYRELIALLTMAQSTETNIRELRGSWAGAFGMPQFLPSSFLSYAVDGDQDGEIDLFSAEDAIASVSHYLMHKGWENANPLSRRKALWEYNNSWYYVDLIEKLAQSAGETERD